jgi:negative regulator of flagellin synthesis FlgM
MQIHGPSQIQGIKGPHTNPNNDLKASKPAAAPADRVDISAAAEAAASAAEVSEVREDLVARVRSEIAAGTYETPDKLDSALDGLLNEMG